jgi:hypothetical protein
MVKFNRISVEQMLLILTLLTLQASHVAGLKCVTYVQSDTDKPHELRYDGDNRDATLFCSGNVKQSHLRLKLPGKSRKCINDFTDTKYDAVRIQVQHICQTPEKLVYCPPFVDGTFSVDFYSTDLRLGTVRCPNGKEASVTFESRESSSGCITEFGKDKHSKKIAAARADCENQAHAVTEDRCDDVEVPGSKHRLSYDKKTREATLYCDGNMEQGHIKILLPKGNRMIGSCVSDFSREKFQGIHREVRHICTTPDKPVYCRPYLTEDFSVNFYDSNNLRSGTVICPDKETHMSVEFEFNEDSRGCISDFEKRKHKDIIERATKACVSPQAGADGGQSSLSNTAQECADVFVPDSSHRLSYDKETRHATVFCNGRDKREVEDLVLRVKDRILKNPNCIRDFSDGKYGEIHERVRQLCEPGTEDISASVKPPCQEIHGDGGRIELDDQSGHLVCENGTAPQHELPKELRATGCIEDDAGRDKSQCSNQGEKIDRVEEKAVAVHVPVQSTPSKKSISWRDRIDMFTNSFRLGACAEIKGVGGSITFREANLSSGTLKCDGSGKSVKKVALDANRLNSFGSKYDERTKCIKKTSDMATHEPLFDWIESECGLLYQIRIGDKAQVSKLLKDTVRVENPDAGKTALSVAFEANDKGMIEYLLSQGKASNYLEAIKSQMIKEVNGATPLMLAASMDSADIVKQMLDIYPTIDGANLGKALIAAVSVGNLEAVELLIQKKASSPWSKIQKYIFKTNFVPVALIQTLVTNKSMEDDPQSSSLRLARDVVAVFKMAETCDASPLDAGKFSEANNPVQLDPDDPFKVVLLDLQNASSLSTPLLTAIDSNCNDRRIIKALMSETAEALTDAVAYAGEKNRLIVLDELIKNGADFVPVALEVFTAKPVQQLLHAALLRKRLQEFVPDDGAKTLRIIHLQVERYGIPRLDAEQGTPEEVALVQSTLADAVRLAAGKCLVTTLRTLGHDVPEKCDKTDCSWTKEGGRWIANQNTGIEKVVAVSCLPEESKIVSYVDLVEVCDGKDRVKLAARSSMQQCRKEVCQQSVTVMDNLCSDGMNVEDAFVDAVNSNQPELVESLLPYVDVSLSQEGFLYAVGEKYSQVAGKILDANSTFHKEALKEALLTASAAGDLETIRELVKLRENVVFSETTLDQAGQAAAGLNASKIKQLIGQYKLSAPKKDMRYQFKKVTDKLAPWIRKRWPKQESKSTN